MAADGSVIIEIAADDNKFEKTASKLGSIASSAVKGITAAITAAGAAITGLSAAAVKVGSDFEREMANLGAITGMAADEMKQMEGGIRDVALESGRSVIEIASNAKMLAEAGGDTNLVLEQLAHGTNLATATQTDLATTLDFLGSAMKTFGVEAEDTQAVVDSFASVTTLANVELAQLGEAYTNVGGAAANAGLGIDDVNAMLVVLSNAGMKGGAAGTSLNAVLRNLSVPTDKAATALDELGVSLYDETGASRDMMLIMQELTGSLGDLSDEQRNYYESAIFDTVAQKGWNMLVAEGIDGIAELSDELGNASGSFDGLGLAAGMAEMQTDTLQGGLSKLKARAQDLGIAFYQSVQDPLKNVVTEAIGYVDELSAAFSEGGLSGLAGALGSVLSKVITEIANAAPMMIDAAAGLLQALLSGFQQNLPTLAQGAVNIVSSLANGIIALLPQLAIVAVQLLTALVEGVAVALPTLVPAAVGAITTLVQGLLDNIPALTSAAIQLLQGLAQGILNAIPVLLEALPELINSLVEGLLSYVSQVTQMWVDLFTTLIDALPNIITQLLAVLPLLIDSLIAFLMEAIPIFIETGIALLTALVEALPEIITAIVEAIPQIIDSVINAILSAIPLLIQAGIDLLVALIQALPQIITTIVEALPKIISGIVNALIGNIDKIIQAGVDLFIALIENLPTIIVEIVKAVPQIIAGLVKGFMALIGEIISVGKDIVSGIWDGIVSMATWIKDKVTGFFSGIVDGVKTFLGIHSPSRVFAEIGKSMGEGTAQGWENSENKVRRVAQKLHANILDRESELQDSLLELQQTAIKRQEEESERAHREAIAAKYKALETAEEEGRQKLLDDIAQLQEKREAELLKKSEQAQKDSLEAQLAQLQAYRAEYEKALNDLESRQESFASKLSGYGALFERTKDELGESFNLRDLEEDTRQITAFGDALTNLRGKGIPEELLDSIAQMSLQDGLEYAEQLLTMTDEEYDKYIEAWAAKQEAARKVAEQFYKNERDALKTEFVDKLPEDLSELKTGLEDVGVDAMQGLCDGLLSRGQEVIQAARSIADSVVAEMQRALDIHSPSRKIRDLVGKPAAQGFMVGFEDELQDFHQQMQATVDRETGKISANAAAQADGKAAAEGVTREIHTTNRTVEKVARVEGDGLTGELVRMLGLKLKVEDRRRGEALA